MRSKSRHYAVIGAVGVVCAGVLAGTLFNQDAKTKAMGELKTAIEVLENGDFDGGIAHIKKANSMYSSAVAKLVSDLDVNSDEKLSKKVALFPRNLQGKEHLLRKYIDAKNYTKAQPLAYHLIGCQLGEYVSSEPSYSPSSKLSSQKSLSTSYAEVLIGLGKQDEAAKQLERSIALFPFTDSVEFDVAQSFSPLEKARLSNLSKNSQVYDRNTIDELVGRSSSTYYSPDQTEVPQDVQRLSDFLILHPDCVPALLTRGRIYANSYRPETALQDANHVLKLFPGLAEALTVRAKAYAQLQKYDLAIADLDDALKQIPNSVSLLREKARQLQWIGKWDEAVAAYNQALVTCPWDNDTRKDLTLLLCAMGRKQEAEKVVDTLMLFRTLDDATSYRYNSYTGFDYRSYNSLNGTGQTDCQSLYYVGRFDDAMKAIEEQKKQHGYNSTIEEVLVRINLEKGNVKDALQSLKASDLNNDPVVDELLCIAYKNSNDPEFASAYATGISHAHMQQNGSGKDREIGCLRESVLYAKFGEPKKALAPIITHFSKHGQRGLDDLLMLAVDLRKAGNAALADELMKGPAKAYEQTKTKSAQATNSK